MTRPKPRTVDTTPHWVLIAGLVALVTGLIVTTLRQSIGASPVEALLLGGAAFVPVFGLGLAVIAALRNRN
ncbi:hypothetical protein [Actinoplanes utahensis]|uniref:Uncharacterized protein n=1 Tax=Actinoplanes utahensis TaxID=1869 RepID=A0A0A6UAE8_ACTUT|nr:hypothetical protein [Actinoplanes utahensis]KHD73010.1 hypothetical protein MB27_37165 [Actinoplanes utahensis]